MRPLLLRCLFLLALSMATMAAPQASTSKQVPLAVDGLIDLRGWDAIRDGAVPLAGTWRWHPAAFVDPMAPSVPSGGAPIQVPGAWNATTGSAPFWGSYELTVQCRRADRLALLLPAQHSAARWFLNGELVHRQGEPADSAAQEQAVVGTRLVPLTATSCPMRLVVHVSNFVHARGGMVQAAALGDESTLGLQRGRHLATDFALMGCFGLLGALTLAFYLVRRSEATGLWFGLFCWSAVAYTGMANERLIERLGLQLAMPTYLRLEYLAWHLCTPLLLLFVRETIPHEMQRRPMQVLLAASALPVAVLLATPAPVFTAWLPYLQVVTLCSAGWLTARLVAAVRHRREGASAFLLGMLVYAALLVADSLQIQQRFEWQRVPYGMVAFVLAAAAAMSQRLARALTAQELRGLEQRHRTNLLVRATKAGILDWDMTTGSLRYSDRYKQMLGHPADADTDLWPGFFEQVHPDDREAVRQAFDAQLRERRLRGGFREHAPQTYRLLQADGEAVWVQAEAIGLVGTDGRTLRYICTFIDITSLKATEQALATERERLRLLVRSTKAGFGDWDAVHDIVTYSDRFKEMLGYPAGQDTSTWPSIFEMMHPDDREQAHAQFRQMIRRKPIGGEQDPGEPMSYRLRRRDGGYIWIHAEGISQVDAAGRTIRFITSYLDVTRFREQEEALRAQIELTRTEQRRLDLVVRGARVGIVDWDGHTHETYYSPRLREILGHATDADTSNWPDYFRVLIHPDDRERVTRRWVAFIKGKGPEGPRGEYYSPEDYRLLRADGEHVWVQASGMAVRDDRGFVVRWIAAIIDISERRAQDQALRASHDQITAQAELLERQNEALKENVRLREDMERIGRHDLKTPLNTIIAVPRLLRERHHLSSDDEELLGIVERAGFRILNLVNLSLDLFRMEQGSYDFRPQPVDLLEVMRNVVADVRAHAATKQLHLDVRVDGHGVTTDTSVHAWAEELLCYSILANLTKNAIEAAPDGSRITIDLRREDPLRLTLHNLGAVPEAVRECFFDKYTTAGKSDGTGLGTYSAWLMARIQGGALQMETSDADGTTLEWTVRPASATQAHAQLQRQAGALRPAPVRPEALPPWRVLAVDDDEFNLLVMRRYMPSPPLTVFTAVNGRAALEQALQCQPNLVLIDLDMPVMNGLEATRRLRGMQQQGTLAHCRIVMLSSHDDDQTRRRALAAGCDHYLCKPVSKDVLLQTLQWAAGQLPVPPHATVRTAADAAADPAAVVIDPELSDRMPAFLQSRRQLLTTMEAAGLAGDVAGVRRQAHRLAGSFSLYGLHWAAAQCSELEHGPWTIADLQRKLGDLRTHIDSVESRTPPAAVAPQSAKPRPHNAGERK
ncbi:MAG TPA: PAS domain-containing protein [Ideonella sp.]|uniref:PAS domain-containing protein n=1 Tax=Ideonella sp. TaxID=1929293 RepID=UPI002E31960B|nr:PAS domain-containing protein [Ideonella sp.]HEX5686242.1 PAS domain-containing protein [Ideonella sp.]